MKLKLFTTAAFTLMLGLMSYVPALAQEKGTSLGKNWAIGLGVGTTGISVDLATTLNQHLQFRAGMEFFPEAAKYNTDMEMTAVGHPTIDFPEKIGVEGKLTMRNLSALVDFYPSKRSSFHFTVGAGFGKKEMIEGVNTDHFTELKVVHNYNMATSTQNQIGLEMGDYLLTPDAEGKVYASVSSNSVKPYAGIGFGRAVPKKHRVGFMFELGCYYLGEPKVYCNDHQLTKGDIGGDGEELLDIISKIPVYPVLKFRLCGRIF